MSKKITPDHIKSLIADSRIDSTRMGQKTCVVCCRLPNGFEIVESSACIAPENYDHEIGVAEAMKKIENRVWELEGYAAH